MLFPYSTDAPLYHRPIGTITVIVLNCVMFWLTGMGDVIGNEASAYRWLILEFDTINPLQWITSAFMHADWMHLVGNMIFLWCFGMIVEGKIGWQRFAALYAGLCLADGAIVQIPMFILFGNSIGGALGASGVIFALMAIAMCWAPENDINCILGIWYYIRPLDVPVFGFATFYLVLQLFPLAFGGIAMSTPLLHLLGMSVGFPFAFYMLKHKLVDCEGWDIVSRWKHIPRDPWTVLSRMFHSQDHRRTATVFAATYDAESREAGRDALRQIQENPSAFNPPASKFPVVPPPPTPPFPVPVSVASLETGLPLETSLALDSSSASSPQLAQPTSIIPAIDLLRIAIQNDQPSKANAAYHSIRMAAGTHSITDSILAQYIKLLGHHRQHIGTLDPLQTLVTRRSKHCNQACLRIARIQLQLKNDRAAAQAAIEQMHQPISPEMIAKRDRLLAACKTEIGNAAPSGIAGTHFS